MKVYILTEWHDAETKTIVGVYLNSREAVADAEVMCAKWNAECPGRDKDGKAHAWARYYPKMRDDERPFAEWHSMTAWSGIYIAEHEVIK